MRVSKFLIPFLAFLLIGGTLTAQSTQEEKKQAKQEKKEAKEAKLARQYKQLLTVIDSQQFVVKAHTYANRYGRTVQVSSTTNFVAVEDGQGTIQLALGSGLGYNGLGGVTVEGRLTDYKVVRKDKQKAVYVQFRIFGGGIGSTDLYLDVFADGRASITVVDMYGGRFHFQGELVPVYRSEVFKGRTLF